MAGRQPRRKPRPGVDNDGRTPLHPAAADGSAAEVAKLLAAGAAPNLQDDNGWSPLHFAAQAISADCTSALLQAGADVSLQDAIGNTALGRAVFSSRGNARVIKLLRAAGADPHARNRHGISPHSLALTIANHDVRQFFSEVDVPQDS